VIIGNFQEDIHTTAVGKMSGPIILANIYLSLLNNQHIISFGFLFTLLLAFSALSYLALFSKMPKLKMNEKIVPSYLSKLIRKYLTYFGCMFLLSLICFFLFQVQVALFLPSFIFAEIETRHKTKESFVNFLSFLKKNFLSLKHYIQRLAKKDKKTGVKKGAFKIKNDT
jgi:amino acid transporter